MILPTAVSMHRVAERPPAPSDDHKTAGATEAEQCEALRVHALSVSIYTNSHRRMQAGDRVPDLTVTTQSGEEMSLDALRDGRTTVVFFYPEDETPLCTKEACSFRDAYADFAEAGAVVLGVSGDSPTSHQAFRAKHDLPYTLIADEDGALRKAFGVPRFLGFFEGRATYVIDDKGIVRHVYSDRFTAQPHVDEALRVVRELAAAD